MEEIMLLFLLALVAVLVEEIGVIELLVFEGLVGAPVDELSGLRVALAAFSGGVGLWGSSFVGARIGGGGPGGVGDGFGGFLSSGCGSGPGARPRVRFGIRPRPGPRPRTRPRRV
uniref:Uncharacterized protein n=1 Tax=Arcella intermedia TaxID=1963864 RepID=A0A6B2LRD6_9EUKA